MEGLDKKTRDIILTSQKNEITEHYIYSKLSQAVKDKQNKEILKQISDDEKRHYGFWKKYTNKDVKPDKLKIWWYYLISRIFGITFGIKLMERGEEDAQAIYGKISEQVPSAEQIVYDEDMHGFSGLEHHFQSVTVQEWLSATDVNATASKTLDLEKVLLCRLPVDVFLFPPGTAAIEAVSARGCAEVIGNQPTGDQFFYFKLSQKRLLFRLVHHV